MPSQASGSHWFIRITGPHEFIETKLKLMKEWIDIKRMAIGYHIGNKTGKEHIHIALELLKAIQQQSINKRIKTLFNVTGSDYSSKLWDGSNKVLSYLYHDEKGKVEYTMHPLVIYLNTHCKQVQGLASPINNLDAVRLLVEFDKYDLVEVFMAMENTKQLKKKYNSANLTVRSWIKTRQKSNSTFGQIKQQNKVKAAWE